MSRLCMDCGRLCNDGELICKSCNSQNTTEEINKYKITIGEYAEISKISHDGNFILAMLKLKNENPIEYELKMRQLKANDTSNKVKCPKCGSTEITAGQKGYSLLTGFLGSNKTVNRCANCGHSWKPVR